MKKNFDRECQTSAFKQRLPSTRLEQDINLNFPPKTSPSDVGGEKGGKQREPEWDSHYSLSDPSGQSLGAVYNEPNEHFFKGKNELEETSPPAFARTKQRSTKVLPWIPSSSVAFFRCSNNTFSPNLFRLRQHRLDSF